MGNPPGGALAGQVWNGERPLRQRGDPGSARQGLEKLRHGGADVVAGRQMGGADGVIRQ